MCACETSGRPSAVICGVHEDKQGFQREHNCILILVIARKPATDRAFQTARPQPTRRVRNPAHIKAGLLAQLDQLHALAAGRQLGPGALQLGGRVAGCRWQEKHKRRRQIYVGGMDTAFLRTTRNAASILNPSATSAVFVYQS
jgi:hypothetical protein